MVVLFAGVTITLAVLALASTVLAMLGLIFCWSRLEAFAKTASNLFSLTASAAGLLLAVMLLVQQPLLK